MKFMVNWEIHPHVRAEIQEVWAAMTPEERADTGDNVRLIGRWHNSAEYTGVAILETDDPMALFAYLQPWSLMMDFDVAPVLDDEESAALSRAAVAAMGDDD